MKPRTEVKRFAKAMEEKLRKNDHKGHWRNCDMDYLLRRAREELEELEALLACPKPDCDDIRGEAADVANFAMMIADNAGALK